MDDQPKDRETKTEWTPKYLYLSMSDTVLHVGRK